MAQINEGWRNWVLGIVATLIVAMILNDVAFQREARKAMTEYGVRLDHIEQRLKGGN